VFIFTIIISEVTVIAMRSEDIRKNESYSTKAPHDQMRYNFRLTKIEGDLCGETKIQNRFLV